MALLRLALAACPLLASAQAASPGGLQQLEGFLRKTSTLRAEFRQEIVSEEGKVIESAQGRFVLKRPGRFRWDYDLPYQRVVVADGQNLWLYEADLEQVTVRPLSRGLGETPAALLTGEPNVMERFEVVSSWSGEAVNWIKLRPRGAESDFDSVTIGFSGGNPVRFELHDRLGQHTRISFSALQPGAPVADSTFAFKPPAGADVIREGEL